MKAPRIPKKLRLPFGFNVTVAWKDQIRGRDGQYDPATTTIEMNRSTRPKWEQIETFAHEYLHAAADFHRWVLKEIVEPLKAEAEETRRHLEER